MDALRFQKKTPLTFAPEVGSERLRRVINKSLPEEDLLATITAALSRGWTNFKLYFMIGLPTETMEDIEGIMEVIGKIRRLRGEVGGRQPQIKINLSTFVPKAHTPFQWAAQESEGQLLPKHEILRAGLRKMGIRLSWQDTRVSLLEAVLARGDRRLGRVIYRAWQLGCRFDAWNECFDWRKWFRAFEECGLEPSFYAHRERSLSELLPWAHIDVGVSSAFLNQEYQRALRGDLTSDCRHGPCNSCGLERRQSACQEKRGFISR